MRRAGGKVRITAQLIRAEDGFHLWSQTYDRPLEDVFTVQTDIAGKVADALGVLLDEQMRARMAESGIRDIDVFLSFQRGRELYHNAHGNAPLVPTPALANTELDAALARMPNLAQAHLLKTDLYTHILFGDAESADSGMTQEEALARLHSSLQAALRHESDRGQRLVMEAVRTFLSDDWHGLGAHVAAGGGCPPSAANTACGAISCEKWCYASCDAELRGHDQTFRNEG